MEVKQETQSLVTVIVPLYNTERYIAETIESVINQTYQNWEMIIVDDCSTDSSRDIAKEYVTKDSRIKSVESEVNFGGPARPRNMGIDSAKGEYIAFLDADDVWKNNKLERQLAFLEKNNLSFTSCDCILINDKSDEIHLSPLSKLYNKFARKKTICDVIKNNFIVTSSVLIRKDLLKNFNEDKKYIAVEDFDMWLHVLANHQNTYKYQEEKLVRYRLLDGSASNRKNVFEQELKANIVLANFVFEHSAFQVCYLKRMAARFLVNFFKQNIFK
ncbi:MAG: glycosyltransferase family 2 protein [Campylobacterales bacterium]|nr:glycosyltransferase family 2 protein [Campylobacterales bacterium]